MKRLIGAKILGINDNSERWSLLSITTDKGIMEFKHYQNCCEEVFLEDGLEDLEKMVGETILFSEEVFEDRPPLENSDYSYTWTFYKISTKKHDCTLRFFGTSNGYYSEDVDLEFREK